MSSYWAEHALLPGGPAVGVRIEVDGDTFGSIVSRERPKEGDVELRGVLLPGLANAHSHAFHRALRGRTHGDGGNFWSWRELMYAVTEQLNPDTYLSLARAVYAEMALAGITAVGEFHYLHHDVGGRRYQDPNAMGLALAQAAREVGIRLTLLDTCYLSGGLTGDGHLPLDAVQQRFSDGSVDGWAARVGELRDGALLRVGAAVHSVRAVPSELLGPLAAAVGDRPVHAHVSEQPAENLAAEMFYRASPTQLLADAGLLSPRFTAVHATHLSEEDIALLGKSASGACFCPTTERDLADGIGPARELLDAGAVLCLGSDQHAVIDPFEEVRGLEMHERLRSNERGRLTVTELMRAASVDGYRCLGWPGGELAAGAPADFVVVADDTVRTVGSKPGQIAFSATGVDVTDVVVAGRRIVRHGQHHLGPVSPMLGRAIDELREH